jgi:hypothetical protein
MRFKTFFLFVALGLLAWTTQVAAQNFTDFFASSLMTETQYQQYLVSMGEPPDPYPCGSYWVAKPGGVFAADPSTHCILAANFGWFAIGGGWFTKLTFVNTSGAAVSYDLDFLSNSSQLISVYVARDGAAPVLSPGGAGFILDAGQATTVQMVLPAGQQLQTGSVHVFMEGPDAASLDAQCGTQSQAGQWPTTCPGGQLTYYYGPQATMPIWQVTVPMASELAASVAWQVPFTESPDNPGAGVVINDSGFAVLNLGDNPQPIKVIVTDNSGNVVASKIVDPEQPSGVGGYVIKPWFGDPLWPACISKVKSGLGCTLYLSGDGLLHGNLFFVGLNGQPINMPIVTDVVGNSIGAGLGIPISLSAVPATQ